MHRYGQVFDADLASASPTYTDGDWHPASLDHGGNVLQLYYKTTVTDPTQVQAKVEFRLPSAAEAPAIPQINSVSGGIIDVDDAVFELPDDLDVWHAFPPIPINAGYEWRVRFTRVGGGSGTHIECHGDLHKV